MPVAWSASSRAERGPKPRSSGRRLMPDDEPGIAGRPPQIDPGSFAGKQSIILARGGLRLAASWQSASELLDFWHPPKNAKQVAGYESPPRLSLPRRGIHRMSLPRSAPVLLGVTVAAQLALCSSLLGVEPKVRKLETSFPAKEHKTVGSGSGIIVGPRLVLTNRHVAMDGADPAPGFQILLAPDYKKKVTARAARVCENYDVAILEAAADFPRPLNWCCSMTCRHWAPRSTPSGFRWGTNSGSA